MLSIFKYSVGKNKEPELREHKTENSRNEFNKKKLTLWNG
jgi:hypothetical protein